MAASENGAHSNWVRMDDVEEVVRGLKSSARFKGPSVDEAVDRVMEGDDTAVYHGPGIEVEVRDDGIEYFVQDYVDDAALSEFTGYVLPRSEDVHDEFVDDVRADIEDAYREVATDGGYDMGTMGDVSHTPPGWTDMENPTI